MLLPFWPERKFTETVSYKTDIIKTVKGEQRIALREYPRRNYQYDFFVSEKDIPYLDKFMQQSTRGRFQMPMWSMLGWVNFINSNTFGNTSSMAVYHTPASSPDNNGVFFSRGNGDYAATTVTAKSGGNVIVNDAIVANWRNGYVMPVYQANMQGAMRYSRVAPDLFKFSISADTHANNFTLNKDVDLFLPFNNYYLFDRRPDASEEMEFGWEPDVSMFDTELATHYEIKSNRDVDEKYIRCAYRFNQKQYVEFLRLLQIHKGRQKQFWMPTWNNEVKLLEPLNSTSLRFRCEPNPNLPENFTGAIYFELKRDCDRRYRVNRCKIDFKNGVVELFSTLPDWIGRDTVKGVHLVQMYRFDQDDFTFTFDGLEYVTTSVKMKSVFFGMPA